ncbi:hypothetical protein ACHQIU_05850 [Raoultella planticola]|jgi:hypothetical protein
MKFGEPGFLTTASAAQIIRTALHLALPEELGPISLAIEMRTTDQDDLWDNERQCREFLQSAWREALR